jgi:hypothetical protein
MVASSRTRHRLVRSVRDCTNVVVSDCKLQRFSSIELERTKVGEGGSSHVRAARHFIRTRVRFVRYEFQKSEWGIEEREYCSFIRGVHDFRVESEGLAGKLRTESDRVLVDTDDDSKSAGYILPNPT